MYHIAIVGPQARHYLSLVFFGGDYLFPDHKDGELADIMDKRVCHLLRYARNVISTVILTGAAFVSWPLYSIVFEGEHAVIIPFILPYTNIEDSTGYLINIINQIILSIIGLLSNFGIECISCMIIENILACVDITAYSAERLNKLLRRDKKLTLESAKLLRNIFIQIQDTDR